MPLIVAPALGNLGRGFLAAKDLPVLAHLTSTLRTPAVRRGARAVAG
jgi:hypothetical protein